MKRFDFRSDLETKGKPGEAAFMAAFPVDLIRLSGRGADFMTHNQESIELKTDYYKDSRNFFFERWSDKNKLKPGGPWQSDLKHVDFYVYWFIHRREYYIFKTDELVSFLETYVKDAAPRMIDIPNKSHTTQGFLVPISALEQLAYSIEADAHLEKPQQLVSGFGK